MTKEFDTKDYKLLYALSQNARLTHTQLAKTLALSKNAITYRIERLKKAGVIEKFLTLVNHKIAGYSFYDVFLKLNIRKEQEKEVKEYFKKHSNLILAYRLSGEWDYLLEIGCRSLLEFYKILNELVDHLSPILDSFETHLSLETYKVEFIPHEICENIGINHVPRKYETLTDKPVVLDELDRQLLYELNRDSTAQIIKLAEKLKKSPETIISRIKGLLSNGIISHFAALLNYEKLGYNNYVVILNLRNPSKQRRSILKQYIKENKNIHFAFLGASKSEVMLGVLVKKIDQLDEVLKDLKERFFDIIVGHKYMLVSERILYDQFPKGLC